MGSDPEQDHDAYEAEQPQQSVFLPDYHIARTPITNAQYAAFVEARGYEAPNRWVDGAFPAGKEDYPVVYVSWYDATAYCKWLSAKNGQVYRLPSEAEWEKAARGTDGGIYPWGNAWDPDRCNCSSSSTMAVTAYASGQSPYRCHDMIGNAWEWTSTLWGSDWKSPDFAYPYRADDGREEEETEKIAHRVFRGGSYDEDVAQLRCSARRWYAPDHADKTRGFRVALDI